MAEMALTDPKIIENVVQRSNDELVYIKSVFPFKLFPTEIVVDEIKVTIIQNYFLYRHYFPILVKDIKTVTVGHGIFFASLKFEIQGYEENPGAIDTLRKTEALKAHQIIVGLIALSKERADLALPKLESNEKEKKLTEIGTTSATPKLK